MKKLKILLPIALALVFSASLVAMHHKSMKEGMHKKGKHHKKNMRRAFKKLDTNKDGKLSKDEWAARKHKKGNFENIDKNKDGYIDKKEIKAHHRAWRKGRKAKKHEESQDE